MNNKTILLVDDDVSQLDLVEILFKNEGFKVQQAISGQVAINYLADNSPDAILIDLMMPNMSGAEAIKKIRADKITCPIIAFTAIDDLDSHQEAIDAGCNLILTKPCKPAELVKEVSKFLVRAVIN